MASTTAETARELIARVRACAARFFWGRKNDLDPPVWGYQCLASKRMPTKRNAVMAQVGRSSIALYFALMLCWGCGELGARGCETDWGKQRNSRWELSCAGHSSSLRRRSHALAIQGMLRCVVLSGYGLAQR
ncbi:uncharacterized protein LAJ45_09886 [Morchella importuna]|uniref:uncharacterized protein n=1 Tax=Morchella importuna TaxID=1174673 RepID=UPI001E8DFB48|nr:uncharacterized protein LAJ45_09886 [Morchella importuna]KAH8146188.1 hypothetical protein LAJ45_09886 [Morchella importuna]